VNRKWRNQTLNKCHVLDTGTNSGSRVPAILTSLTHHCSVNNKEQWRLAKKTKFSLSVVSRKGYGAKKFIKSLRTKTGLCCQWRSSWRRLIKLVGYTVDRKPGSVKSVQRRLLRMLRFSWGASVKKVHSTLRKWFVRLCVSQEFPKHSAQDREMRLKTAVLSKRVRHKTWRLQTNSHVSCQTATEKISEHTIPFIWFSGEKFLLLLCSEPSEWSRNCSVVNFIFRVMYFKW